MAYIVADRVFETSTSTGTGSFNLAGSTAGFRTFVAGVGNGNTCNYEINNGTDWEVGIGTITDGSPDVLARTTVTASSNAGAKVNWGSGTKNVFLPLIASNTAVTAKENTFTATQKIDNIQTTGSSGVAIKNSAGSNVALFGAAAGEDVSFLGKINTVASASGAAGLNVPHGAAPTSPVDGDIWTTTAAIFARINGTTKTVAVTSDIPTPIFSLAFTSSDQTITSAGLLTLAHSLGVSPKLIKTELVCVTGELGYSTGDVLPINISLSAAAASNAGQAVYYDATNVYVRIGSNAGSSYDIIRKDTGARSGIANTKWNLRVTAWA